MRCYCFHYYLDWKAVRLVLEAQFVITSLKYKCNEAHKLKCYQPVTFHTPLLLPTLALCCLFLSCESRAVDISAN